MAEGDAPVRHFISAFAAKDSEGNETGDLAYALDVGVKEMSKRRAAAGGKAVPGETTVAVFDNADVAGRLKRVDDFDDTCYYAERQTALEKGQKVVLSLSLRGINMMPKDKRLSPNVQLDAVFARAKSSGARAVDYDNVVVGL